MYDSNMMADSLHVSRQTNIVMYSKHTICTETQVVVFYAHTVKKYVKAHALYQRGK